MDTTLLVILFLGLMFAVALARFFPGKRAWLMPFFLFGVFATARLDAMYPEPIVGAFDVQFFAFVVLAISILIALWRSRREASIPSGS